MVRKSVALFRRLTAAVSRLLRLGLFVDAAPKSVRVKSP